MELNFVGKLNSLSINNDELAFIYNGEKANFYLYSDNVLLNDGLIKINRINFNLSEMQENSTLTLSINNDRVKFDNQDFIIIDLFLNKAFLVIRKKPELDLVGDFKLDENTQKSVKMEYFSSKSSVINFAINSTGNTTKYPQIIDIWVVEHEAQKELVLQWIYDNLAI